MEVGGNSLIHHNSNNNNNNNVHLYCLAAFTGTSAHAPAYLVHNAVCMLDN